jgi:hypothetical protein
MDEYEREHPCPARTPTAIRLWVSRERSDLDRPGRNADTASFFAGNQWINDIPCILFQSMSVGHAGNVLGEPISKLEGLVVQEFERVDSACFNDVLGERIYFAAIAVNAEHNPTLLLNLHRIINVNRLAIEKHFAGIGFIGLRQRL